MDVVEVSRNVTTFFSSLKMSVDGRFGGASYRKIKKDTIIELAIAIEEARVQYNIGFRDADAADRKSWEDTARLINASMKKILAIVNSDSPAAELRFRMPPLVSPERNNSSQFIKLFTEKRGINIEAALEEFVRYINSVDFELGSYARKISIAELRQLVPSQQVSPVNFQVKNNKVLVAHQVHDTLEDDSRNATSALASVLQNGEKLVEKLKSSNCDPRLVDSIEQLQTKIKEGDNVIQIGLASIACSLMSEQFGDELKGAPILGLIKGYTVQASMYVAQFPDWQKFTQNAMSIEVVEEDIHVLKEVSDEIIESLENKVDIAEPEVPRTIKAVKEMLVNPRATSQKVVFALLRTIENLVAAILRYGLRFVDETGKKVLKQGTTVAAGVIISLLNIALIGANGAGSAAAKAGITWIQQAGGVLIEFLGKFIS